MRLIFLSFSKYTMYAFYGSWSTYFDGCNYEKNKDFLEKWFFFKFKSQFIFLWTEKKQEGPEGPGTLTWDRRFLNSLFSLL